MLDVTVPANHTLAADLGYMNANFDAFAASYNVYFDIKVLADKSRQILDGIIAEFTDSRGHSHLAILPAYDAHTPFELFQDNRNALLAELNTSDDPAAKPTHVQSKVAHGLSYELRWERPGLLIAESAYSPTTHAANHHSLTFKHVKKFARNDASVLVYVVFPWFSETILSLDKTQEAFYRGFAENFFSRL